MPVYFRKGLTGGSAGDLDELGIDKNNGPTGQVLDLTDKDVSIYADGTNVFFYQFDSTGTDAESVPSVIRPDDYSSAGVWKLVVYGSGTLIDADKLDGLEATQFLRSDQSDSLTGKLSVYTTANHVKLFDTAGGTGDVNDYFSTDNDDGSFKIVFWDDSASNFQTFFSINTAGRAIFDSDALANDLLKVQGTPTAKTTSTTLTAAEVATKIITVNNGAAGTTNLTLPTGTAMDSQFTNAVNNRSFELTVINKSTVAAEDATMVTNTGWTLEGNMVIEADDSDRANSSATFIVRKVGTATWELYRK